MNAIAVSLYDKFDDLAVLLDIIRNNWKEIYHISVCSNHPNAEEKVNEIDHDIDYFATGSGIEYSNSTKHYRVYDCIRKSCKGAIQSEDVEFIMHVHADAWPLSEDSFINIVSDMKENGQGIGIPNNTLKFIENYPPGHFKDQFIVINSNLAKKNNLFDRRPLEFPYTSIHHILPMIFIAKFGWGNVYQYSKVVNDIQWDGQPAPRARPMFYRPNFGQLHIAKEDFPDNIGKSLQSYYLKKHNINSGNYVRDLHSIHSMDIEEINSKLKYHYSKYDKKLKRYGLSSNTFDRDVRKIERYLREYGTRKKIIKSIEMNTEGTPLYHILSGVYKTTAQILDYHDQPQLDHKFINEVYQDDISSDLISDEWLEDYYNNFEIPD